MRRKTSLSEELEGEWVDAYMAGTVGVIEGTGDSDET